MTNPSNPDTGATPSSPEVPPSRDAMLLRALEALEDLADRIIDRETQNQRWNLLRRSVLGVLVIGLLSMWVALYAPIFGIRLGPKVAGVAVVPIAGEIGGRGGASADLLVPQIQAACKNARMEAVVLRISSPGGSPSEAERIGQALDLCRTQDKPKPVIAVIEGIGASTAYMIAMQADEVVANRYALVGSIGAVMRTYDASGAAERFGVRERVFASGPLKAGNSPLTPNTPVQDQMTQALVDDVAQQFQDQVRAARGKMLGSDPDLFSGRVWLGPQAHALGLVDAVATYEQVLDTRFKDKAVNTYAPTQSLSDKLGLQSMIDTAIARVWAQASTSQVD